MSTIKVDTIATRTGSGNITVSNNIAGGGTISGTNITASGTLGVTGNTTMGGTAAITGNTTVGGTLTSTGKITSTAGITFGSDTASANVLDDYEEGTFTPTVTFGGGSTGITYSSSRRVGKYTKIGNCVEYYIHVEMTNKGSSTGSLEITGLPFTVTNDPSNAFWFPGAVFIQAMSSLTDGAPIFRAVQGGTTLDCYQISSSSYSNINNTHCTNTSGFQINGKYFINT